MDFSYTEEQQMLQDSVQKFVQNSYDFDTRNTIIASDDGYSLENWQLFAELGWLTVPFSEADGGFGGSAVDLIVMMEAFGKANLVEPFTPTAILGGGLVAALGTDAQKAELLPRVMDGSLQLACAYAESTSRFNLASVSTSAESDADRLVINGSKVAVLNGPSADKLLVVARESGATTDRSGISVFLVDSESEGVSVQAYTNVDGKRAARISFDCVAVPVAQRLGEAGGALVALQAVIDRAIVATSAEAVGALEALLQKTVEYSKIRKQFGTAIGTFQALQHRMADMFIECQLARSIVIMAAMKLGSSESELEKTKSVSAAKSRVGRAIEKVSQEAIQIHGAGLILVSTELDINMNELVDKILKIKSQYWEV